MSHISDQERRRRIGVRHRLAPGSRASNLSEAAASMVALHATDPAGVFLEAWARMTGSSPGRITTSPGTPYEGRISVASKIAFQLALDGHIGRGRPLGTWISGQLRWSPVERWLPGGIRELPVEEAQAELVRRWLLAFGPGTRDDIKWRTGWGVGATRQALAAAGAVEVRLDDGRTGHVLPGDLEATPEPEPAARIDAEAARLAAWLGPARVRWPLPPP